MNLSADSLFSDSKSRYTDMNDEFESCIEELQFHIPLPEFMRFNGLEKCLLVQFGVS